MTSLTQTTGHKLAALRVALFRLLTKNKTKNKTKNEEKWSEIAGVVKMTFDSTAIAPRSACSASLAGLQGTTAQLSNDEHACVRYVVATTLRLIQARGKCMDKHHRSNSDRLHVSLLITLGSYYFPRGQVRVPRLLSQTVLTIISTLLWETQTVVTDYADCDIHIAMGYPDCCHRLC